MSLVQPLEVDLESAQRDNTAAYVAIGEKNEWYDDTTSLIGEDEPLEFGIQNLDDFFGRVYEYYYNRGFSSIVAKSIVNLVTFGFTTIFSITLIGYLDWNGLLQCHSEVTCGDFSQYILKFSDHDSIAFRIFVVLYTILLSAYWLWTFGTTMPYLWRSWQVRQFYQRRLKISTRMLQTMSWSEVVNKIIEQQKSGVNPIQINGKNFTAKEVAMRILRKENYMIAMINESILPVGTRLFGEEWFLGKNLELMLELCILNHMYTPRFTISRDFVSNPQRLKRRFIVWGILNILVMPCTLGFMIIYSFLKYAEEFHSKRNYLGPRWWTAYALWEFREFNEVQHIFDKRVLASVRPADQYLKQFPTPVITHIATGVSFIAGAIIAILMLFTLMDESILLHIKLGGRDLVWYFAIGSGVLAIARAFIPSVEEMVYNPYPAMRQVVVHNHYLPDHWRKNAHSYNVRDEFSDFFQYKVVILLREMMCVFTTPFVLIFVLPGYAKIITEFIKSRTCTIDGLGDVCVYSKLELSQNGDPQYGSQLGDRDPETFVYVQRATPRGGKLEKSWLNFKLNYASTAPEKSLARLDELLRNFQAEQIDMLKKDENSVALSLASGDSRDNSKLLKTLQVQGVASQDGQNFENYFYWLEHLRCHNV